VFEGSACALGLCIQSMNDVWVFFAQRHLCVMYDQSCVCCVGWCVAGFVSLQVASRSMSDGKNIVQVKKGEVPVDLRWIDRVWEPGSVGDRVNSAGFLDPPFWLHHIFKIHNFEGQKHVWTKCAQIGCINDFH